MIDSNNLFQILHVNGLNEKSSLDEIEVVFKALGYSQDDKNQAKQFLMQKGWSLNIPEQKVEVSNIPQIPIETPVKPVEFAKVAPVAPLAPLVPNTPKKSKKVIILVVVIFILVIGAMAAYAYVEKIGIFSLKSYTENNFLSSLLTKSSKINTSSYKFSASLAVGPRDAGAEPFTVDVTNQAQLREEYQNDSTRAQSVSAILSILRSKLPSKYISNSVLPSTLTNLFKSNNTYYFSQPADSVNDPVSNQTYGYTTTDSGTNFKLSVTFQTNDAINAIKQSYGFTATTTIINGLNVTFTKGSPSYLYLSSEPPQPFFVQMSNDTAMLSSDTAASVAVTASSDFTNEALANWLFNLDAEGSFGDLTYKVNVDALKKDDNYYIKVNNMPSLFSGGLDAVKGEWIKIPTATTTATTSDSNAQNVELSYLSQGLPSFEKSYKEKRQEFASFLKKAATIADEEGLITFKNPPTADKVNGIDLVRYDLSIKKDALVPFYTKLSQEVSDDPTLSDFQSLVDKGLVEYLQSPEFNQVFDYYDKNTDLLFWTDSNGFPAAMQETFRIVPPDSALQLKEKQINLIFRLELSNINKPVDVEAPASSTPIEDVIKNLLTASYGNNISGIGQLKADLSSVRREAMLVNSKDSGYGKVPFTLGICSPKASTLFGESVLYSYIEQAQSAGGGKATCVSKGSVNNVRSYAVSVPLSDSPSYSWCVDSAGNSKQIIGTITSDICK